VDITQALPYCITNTEVSKLSAPYKGKVREVYELNSDTIGIVVTDRISAFDYIMRQAIPFKGQILNKLAAFGFSKVRDILPNHIIEVPHPNVTIAKKCDAIPIEVVFRAHLTGHAWREYKLGKRILCGVAMPDGLKEHDPFPQAILTPATKAMEGHDEDISEEEILSRNMVDPKLWEQIKTAGTQLFKRGQEVAQQQGLILVDTKYEFGLYQGQLTLIDEVHTTDSSRYFYADGFQERQAQGASQQQLSKEFLREWLMDHNFQGLDGQTLPDLPDEFRLEVYERYSELFKRLTGEAFQPELITDINQDLERLFSPYL